MIDLHRDSGEARLEEVQLYTFCWTPAFVGSSAFVHVRNRSVHTRANNRTLTTSAGAAHAGLFPFASEIENFPGQPLSSRCALNLELGGVGRE